MTDKPHKSRRAHQVTWVIAIIVVATMAGMVVVWRAPGLDLYARDRLMRARGPLALPDEIAIVAIDEASIARFGRFPWPRALMADALDRLAAAGPRVVALDILYSEPTTNEDDRRLADSIARAGKVVVAAQLIGAFRSGGGDARQVEWLRPLPEIARAAAGVGHINVLTESDGAARALPWREADDEGQPFWSLAVETIRVGDGLSEAALRDLPHAVVIGTRVIPVEGESQPIILKSGNETARTEIVRAGRLAIDYIGPTGSFAARTFSFADLIDGKISPEVFRNRYVLLGATAATLGEQVASPFVHDESADGNQHGALMPGVEVLANAVNTILRARFYRETPDWLAALYAALAAAAALGLLAITHGRYGMLRQMAALSGLIALILALAYIVFSRWLIVPPLIPALMAVAIAAPLGLLRRSFVTGLELDERIAELSRAGTSLSHSFNSRAFNRQMTAGARGSGTAALIAQLAEAEAVAIFVREGAAHAYQLAATHGAPVNIAREKGIPATFPTPIPARRSIAESLAGEEPASRYFSFEHDRHTRLPRRALVLPLGEPDTAAGTLVIAYPADDEPQPDTLRLCVEIAASFVAATALGAPDLIMDDGSRPKRWWTLPRGMEWKARLLGALNRRALQQTLFVDRALRSVEDGLIVAGADCSIVFVNPRAMEIFGLPERVLLAGDLFDRLREAGLGAARDEPAAKRARKEMLLRLIVERAPIEREITIGSAPARHYTLRLSAVCAGDGGSGAVLGLVASLADITRQRELQQIKNDVMALVTHELRTPLTAIQGMSELLAQYDVAADRQREMHLAINHEAKRLMRMINDYLDIARLESGAIQPRLAPVSVAPLIERTLLLLDPMAEQREIRIVRRFAPNLPPLMADAELLARAVTNLAGNAIKYSPAKTETIVELRADGDGLRIEVADRGPGIPADSLERVFEKFYRVPRLADAETPGTGLGLALVREVAELHGGRVTVESEVGVGSTFTLRLPFAAG